MKQILLKTAFIIFVVIIGLTACGKKEAQPEKEAPPQAEQAQEEEVEVNEGQVSGFTEEQKIAAGRELLDIWYVKRLSAENKEELDPVREIFKDPEGFKSAIEVFFDNGIAGKFKNIKVQLNKERTVDIRPKVYYYETEATVSSINKDTGEKESFKELVKMMIEQNDAGKFLIHDLQGSMVE
ncbi:MAG TPA: hypothetical protein GXX18_00875 [Bacillales bacterium]|nr:hypothetical protein [Bacillales bacterium]